MMKKNGVTFLMSVFVLIFLTSAWADEVYLKNGNHLSGKMLSMGSGQLIFETEYAGKLSIDWNHVERLMVGEPLEVVLKDGSVLKGTMKPSAAGGQMALSASFISEPSVVALESVSAINPPDEPAVKLSGIANLGYNKTGGNTDTEDLHGDAEMVARSKKHRFTVGGAYNSAEVDNEKSEDNATGYLKHDYFLTKKVYWYVNGKFETDEFKDINLRTIAGTGLGYQIFESELMNLQVEAGPSYVNTDYDEAEDEDHVAGRWGVKFDRYFYEKLFQYYFTNVGLISVSDTNDFLMFTKTGLRFPIRMGFFLNLGYEWDYDHEPAEGTEESDHRYILSLGYGF